MYEGLTACAKGKRFLYVKKCVNDGSRVLRIPLFSLTFRLSLVCLQKAFSRLVTDDEFNFW